MQWKQNLGSPSHQTEHCGLSKLRYD